MTGDASGLFHVKRASPPLPEMTDALAARLDTFLDLLLLWNRRINLVAERDREAIRARHVLDSLQLFPLMPAGDGVHADLGSGGGFPGLVLAIAGARPTYLIESDRRKAAFLTEAAARLGLSHVTVFAGRAEEVALPPVAVITARALAPLGMLLVYAAELLAPGGVAIFPKGRTAESEVKDAAQDWTFRAEGFTSRTDPASTILRLSDIHRAGQAA